VWLVRRKHQEAEERCCDADVLRAFPQLRASYGEALLDTVDFLTHARCPAIAGTGLGTHKSLKRRFEMLVSKRVPVRPRPVVKFIVLVAAVAAVLTAPRITAWAELEELATTVPASAKCTVSLDDGRVIEGEVVSLASDRLVIKLDSKVVAGKISPDATDIPIKASATEDVWELTLGECVTLALQNNKWVRVVSKPGESLILATKAGDADSLSFRSHIENTVRDVEDSYWIVWLAFKDLEAVKDGRDRAQETWRKTAALFRTGSRGGSAADEAGCRVQYFQLRGQVEDQITDLHQNEQRLRYHLGLPATDGRLIKPTDKPETDRVSHDWNAVHQAALKYRVEIIKQRQEITKREDKLERRQRDAAWRQSSEARHLQLLLGREKALLNGLELEISHQLGDALRDVDLNFGLMQTNFNRAAAAKAEVDAVDASHRAGIATLDLLLDAQRRVVDAVRAYNSARTDYARALSQVDARKGTLLARHGLKIADGKSAE
jgi:hypothetical protein